MAQEGSRRTLFRNLTMWAVFTETIRIFCQSAPYLLIGFALAGVLHVLFERSERFSRLLSQRGSRSVFLAAMVGAPLPLCSCSVLPAALALRKNGASKGATTAFLISCPETDIVSISMTYGLLGPLMAVVRPVAAVITAIFAGHVVDLVDRWTESARKEPGDTDAEEACQCRAPDRRGAVGKALRYGFVEFLDDITGSLLVGLLLGGLITALLPKVGLEGLSRGSIWTLLAMLLIGMPMYVCASASTPIAAGLIAGGLSPGAALVFLLGGPATNAASVVVLAKHFGKLATVVYLLCIATVSLGMGLALDAWVTVDTTSRLRAVSLAVDAEITAVETGASVLLAALMILSLRRTRVLERSAGALGRVMGVETSPRAVRWAAVIVALAAYLGSGFFIVGPGQRGVILRFGRITADNLGPGWYYSWPYPMGGRDRTGIDRIRRVEFGYRSRAGAGRAGSEPAVSAASLLAESWMLTGNEDIMDIKWAVQYRVKDSPGALLDYLYGVENEEQLVRDAAESAIRAVAGRRNVDTLYTVDRAAVEDAVREQLLQPRLDRCNAGIEVVAVKLQDVHAPSDVHAAFRDVASAAEDLQTSINAGYEYQERVTREAAGEAAQVVLAAEAQATDRTERAAGEAQGFIDRVAAYQSSPQVTRLRLYFEVVDQVYGRLAKYVNLIEGLDGGLDLWVVPEQGRAPLPPVTPDQERPAL